MTWWAKRARIHLAVKRFNDVCRKRIWMKINKMKINFLFSTLIIKFRLIMRKFGYDRNYINRKDRFTFDLKVRTRREIRKALTLSC
jgi:hypothetical protein